MFSGSLDGLQAPAAAVNQINRNGTHEQKLKYLPKLIRGKPDSAAKRYRIR